VELGDAEPPQDLFIIDQAINLLDPGSVAEAIDAVEQLEVRPRLVVLDTYARSLVGGDENSARDTGEAVAAIDRLKYRLDCAVLVVHHKVKSGNTDRGSGALAGAVDTKIRLDRKDKTMDLTLIIEKQKNFEAGDPILLTLAPAGDSLVPKPREAAVPSFDDLEAEYGVDDGLTQSILEALRAADDEHCTPIGQTALLSSVRGNADRRVNFFTRWQTIRTLQWSWNEWARRTSIPWPPDF
jgi:hypothetical protein